jgi:hypothetical protein
MNIQTIYESILEEVLPTPWSRRVAAITAPLSVSSLFLPNFLKKMDIVLIPEASLYIRLVLPLLILLTGTLTVLFLVVRHHKKANSTESDIQQYWKYHKKIALSHGAYHDVLTKKGEKFFRITLKDISRKNMPPQYETPGSTPDKINTDVATLSFSTHFMYHGFRVKKIHDSHFSNEETFYLPQHDYQEESDSVFFFKTEHVTNGGFFFRCFVDHINPAKKEVDLDIYFIWENPTQ